MKYIFTFLVIAFVQLNASLSQNAIDYVNLFIGTSGDHGQLDPSATVPFGKVKIGPDTEPSNHSGYNYEADKITGFSHNRIGGVGCSGAGGNLRILPVTGNSDINFALFDKKSEVASPAYYSVVFDNKIKAELTANQQTAFHKYTYPASDSSIIKVDLGSSFAELINAKSNILSSNEFTAEISAQNVCNFGRYTVYYYVIMSKEVDVLKNENNELVFGFPTKANEEFTIEVTASSISVEDAQNEWQSQKEAHRFNEIVDSGKQLWSTLLDKIEVEGKEEYKQLFYTHLYHTFLNPVKNQNSKGQFKATDGKIYSADNHQHYDTWSMWDNFRNKFALYALIIPDESRDMANSLVDLFTYGKPKWSGYDEPSPTVRTEHTVITLLDLYRRGVSDFEIEKVYQKLIAEIDNIPASSPDTRLEKSYDLWALSEMANILGKNDDHELLMSAAMQYKQVWRQYFLHMGENADIMHAEGLYEGTLWQYRWHTQFDITGMIEMMGGKEKYTEQLSYFFEKDLYNHGNQPDIHVPFMFNYGTKPWLTQKWVNKILTREMTQYYGTHGKWDSPFIGRIYRADPEGYIPEMDDDEGTMSAWYVLSALGFYPVEVGKPEFQLSAPIFDKVTIHLDNGKTFEISSKHASDDHFYIQNTTLNGSSHNSAAIKHSDMSNGGHLIYELSNIPNKNWGSD